jgi:hypothetical protein
MKEWVGQDIDGKLILKWIVTKLGGWVRRNFLIISVTTVAQQAPFPVVV